MNGWLILSIQGKLLLLEAALMLPSLGVALAYGEGDAQYFLASIAILLACGGAALIKQPVSRDVRAKEGLVAVSLAWVLLSAFGALPFLLSGAIPGFVDAMFETVSGFTTTGASILPQVENENSESQSPIQYPIARDQTGPRRSYPAGK